METASAKTRTPRQEGKQQNWDALAEASGFDDVFLKTDCRQRVWHRSSAAATQTKSSAGIEAYFTPAGVFSSACFFVPAS